MNPEELKLACLHHANGDLAMAKELFEWVSGEVTTVTGSPMSALSASDAYIQTVVDRFLAWKLPKDFAPDGGITLKPSYEPGHPSGTNLFTGVQAEAMVRHILGVA